MAVSSPTACATEPAVAPVAAKPSLSTADVWSRCGDAGRFGLIAAAVILPLKRRNFDGSFDGLTAVLTASTLCKAIKPFVPERRPNGEDCNSFPSQHAAESFAAALALRRHFGKTAGALAVGAGTWVAMTRLFALKHYTLDVVAGIAIGAAALGAVDANARMMSLAKAE
jgi:membrane-associated phospholipid phosphatase